MLSNEGGRYILNEFLINVSSISDLEYQKRVWIRGEGPECDDFTETVCHFFDDGNPILENYKDYGITENQYALLTQLRDTFDAFVNGTRPYLPQEFIDTPKWKEIMAMARKVLTAFHYRAK